MNAFRWGLVTFAGSVCCAIVGHYVPDEGWIFSFLLAFIFSGFGALAIMEQR